MSVKLLTEHHLEFLSFKVGCVGSSESTLVKMPHCWKSHVTAHFFLNEICKIVCFKSNGACVTLPKADLTLLSVELLFTLLF